jgi:hypothetical protein
MPTICPNCLRPVRSDAKYCGFCGTNLNPSSHEDIAVALTSPQENVAPIKNPADQTQYKSKGRQLRRILLVIVIILLCLVLLMAFLIHYWPVLNPFFGALISIL